MSRLPVIRRAILYWILGMLVGITGAVVAGALISDIAPVLRGIRPAYTIIGETMILLTQLVLYIPFMFVPLSVIVGVVGGGLHGLYIRNRLGDEDPPSRLKFHHAVRAGLIFAWAIIILIAIAYIVVFRDAYSSTPFWVYSVGLVMTFALAFLLIERFLMRWFSYSSPDA